MSATLSDALRMTLITDDHGRVKKYCHVWETWPFGEYGSNFLFSTKMPLECPVCMGEVHLVDDGGGIFHSTWVCLSCQTVYHDLLPDGIREQFLEKYQASRVTLPVTPEAPKMPTKPPVQEKEEAVKPVATTDDITDLKQKYRYLISA